MTRIAVTGGFGFLGWHTCCRLRALHGVEAVRLGRQAFADSNALATAMSNADVVLHLAGVNRAASDDEVEHGNTRLGGRLADAIRASGRALDVVYSNSIHAQEDNAYGRGKAAAAELLLDAVEDTGGHFADLQLPNLFGEHGRPDYNSFVATFAAELVGGRIPVVTDDRELPLMHVQDAAQELIGSIGSDQRRALQGQQRRISDVLQFLKRSHELYAERGEIPPLPTRFDVNLFNTYRAAAFPGMWPLTPHTHSDDRGDLYEMIRSHGGTGQAFVSTTKPGRVRGDHFHFHKVERFLVVKGVGEVRVRKLLSDEVHTFRLSGDRASYVDMPTLWVHNIRNVGAEELVTMFWSDQLLNAESSDQYAEKVDPP